MPLIIRPYESRDHDALWALFHAAHGRSTAPDHVLPWASDLHDISGRYLEPGGAFLVGKQEGEIVVMGALDRETQTRAKVRRFAVHPTHQRKGYGRALWLALLAEAQTLGILHLWLNPEIENVAAQRFWEAQGLSRIGIFERGGFALVKYELTVSAEPG